MRLVSFNINGIRARLHQLEAVRAQHAPLVLGVQETKVADDLFPADDVAGTGFKAHWHGQKGHYGVAVLSPPDAEVELLHAGYPWDADDAQRRFICTRHALPGGGHLKVVNGYFPQGESRDHPVKFPGKERFYADLLRFLEETCDPGEPLVVMGDMNVAPVDEDIGIGADNVKRWLRTGKASFLPEERDWLSRITAWGLTDTWRHLHPDVDDRFSWFDYRSRGFEREPRRGLRIDHVLVTAPLLERLTGAGIDYDIRSMEKPSDHCPVWAEFED